jgi:hypothetical protein
MREIPALIESTPPKIPDFIHWARKIGVAANDAGGAEQIVWLIRKMNYKVKAYLDGPAIRIFERSGIDYEVINSISELIDSELVITGSGWMSPLENEVIRQCQTSRIACVTLLDHWVNYHERFLKDPDVTPNMLAVTNLPALILANKVFPGKPIWLLPDFQIESYKVSISKENSRRNVLVLFEPSPTLASIFYITSEMEEELIKRAFQLKESKGLGHVELRLHPSQDRDSQRVSNLRVKYPQMLLSRKDDLVDDLRSSAVVLGFSTYGLYISAMCGMDTRSYFAGAATHWTSQFKLTITPLGSE